MPLGQEYNKMLDSKEADMRNIGGGRWGGSITAACFLERFIQKGQKWAHMDIAGVVWSDKPKPYGWHPGRLASPCARWISWCRITTRLNQAAIIPLVQPPLSPQRRLCRFCHTAFETPRPARPRPEKARRASRELDGAV